MIVESDHVSIILLVGIALRLLLDEIIRKAWAMDHLLSGKILHQRIAGVVADQRQMIIVGIFDRIGSAAENLLMIVAAIHMRGHNHLSHAAFATDAPGAFFGADQSGKK